MQTEQEQLLALVGCQSSEITDNTETYNFLKTVQGKTLSDFNLIRFIVRPGKTSMQDQHAVKEYWYIAQGEGQLFVNAKEVSVREGDLYFFDSFETHRIQNTSLKKNLEILSIWW